MLTFQLRFNSIPKLEFNIIPFSTNMAISETKGQGWRAIHTQRRKASNIF